MWAPVLTCVQFAADGVTCTQTQWVQQTLMGLPPLSIQDGISLGGAILGGCVVLWAAALPRRA